MELSRDKYVRNTPENVEKLVRKIMEGMDFDTMRQSAYQGLTAHYIDQDQSFVEDYYETFPDEDPELTGIQEENVRKIIYYHGQHTNPCVLGEIHRPEIVNDKKIGTEVIMITHDIPCKDYNDNLSDITKIWDSGTQVEVCNNRYDTDPDTCIHIPLDIGKHTSLSNQVLKHILLNNNIDFVSLERKEDLISLSSFLKNNLGV